MATHEAMHDWSIPGADDQPIWGTTHLPSADVTPRGVLLICHGFKGYKDYGFMPLLASAVAEKGLVAHRFNFSHSGMTNQIDTFERPDLFERDTWGKQIDDLQLVTRAALGGLLPGSITSATPVFWFGHSRGGVTVLLTAGGLAKQADDQLLSDRLGGVIAVAAPSSGQRLDEQQIKVLRRQGYLESPSIRTGQTLRVGGGWLDEIEANPDAYDPQQAIGQILCPVLLVHGDADMTVPVEAAHQLAQRANPSAQMQIIEGASHTFNCPNPMSANEPAPPQTQAMIQSVMDFVASA